MKYADVIIDNSSDNTDNFYTYGCNDDFIYPGQRVTVPFAKGNREVSAYVFRVYDKLETELRSLKYILHIDEGFRLTQELLDTCSWMKKRYLCRYIDAIKCAVPAGSPAKRRKTDPAFGNDAGEAQDINELTPEQANALKSILPAVKAKRHEAFLIHGVTSSGKTEIYMRLISECISRGEAAIVMVPEIALTKQLVERFIGRFGAENVAVLHSKLTSGQRYDEWTRIRNGRAKIAIGARSAVFAPFEAIGAIILDEEHEATYKSDMTPKYETAEVALKRAIAHNAVFVLGSATPSVVSMSRAHQGIYQLIELKERYNKVQMPEISVVDMRQELKAGNKTIFSADLYRNMENCLRQGKQVILFLNRRGYSNFVSCRECGYIMRCPNCGISLTYHKSPDKAVCHYCGYNEYVPRLCPSCGSRYLKHFGTGTEKVEEAARQHFSEFPAARMDLDTIKRRGSIDRILDDFKNGRTRILIGTQLVAKGLDFVNVGVVGIISADVSLNIPDFRSAERTFQLITQAAGRAGRGNERGRVIVQSYTPDHYAIRNAVEMDYHNFFTQEIALRKTLGYPPFSDLIQLIFTSGDEAAAKTQAEKWEKTLRLELIGHFGEGEGHNVFDAQPGIIRRSGGDYRYHIIIRCPNGKRKAYSAVIERLRAADSKNRKREYNISIDINPYSFI